MENELTLPPPVTLGKITLANTNDSQDTVDHASNQFEVGTAAAATERTGANESFTRRIGIDPLVPVIPASQDVAELPESLRSVEAMRPVVDEVNVITAGDYETPADDTDYQKRDAIALFKRVQEAKDKKQDPREATNRATRQAVVTRGGIQSQYLSIRFNFSKISSIESVKNQSRQIQDRPDVVGSNSEISNGIESKPNRRPTLQISPAPSFGGIVISNFFISDIREEDSEKFQIQETFGTNFVFFFGRKPRIYVVSGVLINSRDKDWKNEFKGLYDKHLRGTQLAKNRQRAVFSYEDVVREGYMLNFSYSHNAQNPHAIPFSFSLFVTREDTITIKRTVRSRDVRVGNDLLYRDF